MVFTVVSDKKKAGTIVFGCNGTAALTGLVMWWQIVVLWLTGLSAGHCQAL
jgi:hypothetical protein